MSEYVYGHVTVEEARKFEKYIMVERQLQYIRAVLRWHSKYGVKKLKSILEWKFGRCILSDSIIKKVKDNS